MKTILLIDDESLLRSVVAGELELLGYKVIQADDGDKAVEIAVLHRPDLIISDINMDGLNGFMLREELKNDVRTSEIPFILITGYAGKAGAWESEADVIYLSKPFPMSDLIQAIETQLSRKVEKTSTS